jgi:hypothetical protein
MRRIYDIRRNVPVQGADHPYSRGARRRAAPLDDYSYPEDTGEFTGTLTFRCWHRNKPMLLCYFDTDDGRKFKLPVWWQSWGVNYSPAESYINFADEVYDGSRWHCTYRKKQNGYISWCCAESIE